MPSFWKKRIEMPWLRPVIAYSIGVLVVIWGADSLCSKIEIAATSPVKTAEYVLAVTGMIWGLLICIATPLRYQGGLWSALGALLVGGAIVGTVTIVEAHLRGWHFDSPVAFHSRIAACWAVGAVFLVMGHRRHRRMQPTQIPAVEEVKKQRVVALIGIAFLGVLAFTLFLGYERRGSHHVAYPSAVPAGQWKRFTSDEGRFSIRFPGNPEQTNILSNFSRAEDEKKVETVEVETQIFYVNPNIQNSFAAGYCDSPLFSKAAKLPNPQIFLETSQAILTANEIGKVVFEQESKFDGFPAREIEYAAGGKANYSVRVKYILAGSRVYIIYVVFLTANPHPQEREIFFNSFKILAN